MERREETRACANVFRAAGPSAEELLQRWIELIGRLEREETERSGERA